MRIGNQDYQFCLSSDDALDSGHRSVRLLSLLILSVVTAVTDLKLRHSVRSLTSPYNLVPSLTLKSPLFLMVICFSITPAFAWNGLNTTTVLSVSSNAVTVGTAVVFTATVTDQNASPVGTGQVVFCDATVIYCEDMAVLGKAQLTSTGTAAVEPAAGRRQLQHKSAICRNDHSCRKRVAATNLDSERTAAKRDFAGRERSRRQLHADSGGDGWGTDSTDRVRHVRRLEQRQHCGSDCDPGSEDICHGVPTKQLRRGKWCLRNSGG